MKKHIWQVFVALSIFALVGTFAVDIAFAFGSKSAVIAEKWEALMKEYRVILAGIAGFGALTSILVFIFHMIQLGSSQAHPIQRHFIIRNLLISAICTAGLGGLSLFLSLFYSVIFG